MVRMRRVTHGDQQHAIASGCGAGKDGEVGGHHAEERLQVDEMGRPEDAEVLKRPLGGLNIRYSGAIRDGEEQHGNDGNAVKGLNGRVQEGFGGLAVLCELFISQLAVKVGIKGR